MIKYRNIGYDWDFYYNYEQQKLLEKYYDANNLLVDCLNSDCYVSREVRQEIEDTLLLPISDIRKRQKQPITERSPTLKIISRLWRGLTSK
ncbi:MAG: hypothetical protein GDA43_17375 [Hormoscilla sp. SP5CHS1]|nr:hypothetical protein [Hormoscilla sp. SP12CHS1]MBC6454751.1 hypothetical protein [Hormoscilla sp. SP5CHS1]